MFFSYSSISLNFRWTIYIMPARYILQSNLLLFTFTVSKWFALTYKWFWRIKKAKILLSKMEIITFYIRFKLSRLPFSERRQKSESIFISTETLTPCAWQKFPSPAFLWNLKHRLSLPCIFLKNTSCSKTCLCQAVSFQVYKWESPPALVLRCNSISKNWHWRNLRCWESPEFHKNASQTNFQSYCLNVQKQFERH